MTGHPTTVYVRTDGTIEKVSVGAGAPQKLNERVGLLAAGESVP